jgi:aspartokinase-like uncharacterized kinase
MTERPLVVKVGGALSHVPGALDDVARALPALARTQPVIVIPGGGPFADQVRRTQHDLGASEDAAHWMAILGMDQYAHLLADRLPGARLVHELHALAEARAGDLFVFAPYRWMQRADPLPHTWDATSDSIAAVAAGELGARELLLVKVVSGTPETLGDALLPSSCPPGLEVRCVTTPGLLALAGLRHEPPEAAGAPAPD